MSTPALLPEVVPEIDANQVSFYWGGERVDQVWSLTRQSLLYVNFNDNAARDDAAGDDNTELYLQFFDRCITNTWGLGSLQNTKNEANLLLPLGIQKLKVFQLQGATPLLRSTEP